MHCLKTEWKGEGVDEGELIVYQYFFVFFLLALVFCFFIFSDKEINKVQLCACVYFV